MINLAPYFLAVLAIVAAFGGYVVVIERRLTRIETTLKFVQEQVLVLVKKLNA